MNLKQAFAPIFAAALPLLLSSCTTVGPAYRPPAPVMPAQWQESGVEVFTAGSADAGVWWTLFNDPALNALIAEALTANQDLRLAEARIREARAERRMTATRSLPALGASGSATNSRTGENTGSGKTRQDLFQAGFDMSWELDLFGGIRRATEAADAAVDAAVEDRKDIRVSLAAEVARNYIELRGARQRLAITRETLGSQEQTVEMVKKKLHLGLGGELAVVQAETQLAMTRAQLPGMETAAAQATHQLALLLGRPPEEPLPALQQQSMLPAPPPRIPVTLPSELLRQRPDIRRAERKLAAATAEVGVATAELFPKFSLTALLGLESVGISDFVTSGSRYWSAGPKVTWSLFDGGKARAGIEASDSRREQAEILYEKTVLTALVEVENALVAFAREQETYRSLKTAAESAQRAFGIATTQYRLGLVDFLNVLQSEQAVQQSRDQLVQSEQRLCLDMTLLFKALGGDPPQSGA